MKALMLHTVLGGCAFALLALVPNTARADSGSAHREAITVYTAVVRHVTGDVRASGASVSPGDLPDSGQTFATGSDGQLTIRFHPDMTIVEVRPSSRLALGFSQSDSAVARTVTVHEGRALTRVAQGVPLSFEDAHAQALVRRGRVTYATGAGAATILVLEGEAKVFNRKTGAVVVVTRGNKAEAGPTGTVVTRANDRELAAAGERQNVLEVDFWNPATEDYRTLEVEYEARPRGP